MSINHQLARTTVLTGATVLALAIFANAGVAQARPTANANKQSSTAASPRTLSQGRFATLYGNNKRRHKKRHKQQATPRFTKCAWTQPQSQIEVIGSLPCSAGELIFVAYAEAFEAGRIGQQTTLVIGEVPVYCLTENGVAVCLVAKDTGVLLPVSGVERYLAAS